MVAKKSIKEDPPELESKIDREPLAGPEVDPYEDDVEEVQAGVDDAVADEPAFKEAPAAVSPEVALLIEQNRVLMAKLEAMTGGKVPGDVQPKKDGPPVLDHDKPIISQRGLGYHYYEQDGCKFSEKGVYIGEVA